MWRITAFIRHICGERKNTLGHRWFRLMKSADSFYQLFTFGTGYGSTFLPPSTKSLGPAFSRSEMKIRKHKCNTKLGNTRLVTFNEWNRTKKYNNESHKVFGITWDYNINRFTSAMLLPNLLTISLIMQTRECYH